MNRRSFLRLAAAGATRRLFGQSETALRYRDYSVCLPDYLRELARSSYTLRNAALRRLTTADSIRARQQWVRDTFWKLAGGEPERTPLRARTTGSFMREGYRLEKVVYESQPNFHVSANLYIPTSGRPPYPGVLFQMGHSANGKAAEPYQKCCQGLARLGFLVLGFDPMGQGERTYYPGSNPARSRLPGGADDEHTVPGKQMLLVGDSSIRLQTWDAVRSLDYLAAHPLADTRRLASAGQSGGGTNTMLLAAVDERLAAAAVACGNTENVACADFNPPGSTDDAEQNFAGAGPLGFDRWDLLYPLAPKPLLVMPSARDYAGTYSPNYIGSGWEEFGKLRKVYEAMGQGERLGWHNSPLPHGLTYGLRMAIYNWFLRWLKDSEPIAEEPPVEPEAEAALFASPGGSVVRAYGGETPLTLLRKRAGAKQAVSVDALLAVERPAQGVSVAVLAKTRFRDAAIEAIEIPSAAKVWLPAWLYRPRKEDSNRPLVVLIEPGGRGQWQEGGLYEALAAHGYPVCALDVRGIGDLTPEFGRGGPHHGGAHHSEQHYAWSSLILGRPLLGQRVTDLLAAVEALRARPEMASRRLVLAARGILTAPAQFAASLTKGIDALYLAGGLVSFRSVIEAEEYLGGNYHAAVASQSDLFGSFVPGLLLHTDLPEVTSAIAPRPVRIAGAIDAAGKTVEVALVKRTYPSGHVEAVERAEWNAAALAGFAGKL